MQWEMYGAGTELTFRGFRSDGGYELAIVRDDTTVFSTRVADVSDLLRQSSQLRDHLHTVGYSTQPRASAMVGGICWGPAAPLGTSLIDALKEI